MAAGAAVLLCTGELTVYDAFYAIDLNVMGFLFGMFIIGEALHRGGYLSRTSDLICRISRNRDHVLLVFICIAGCTSAILMNDTVAIIGTPLALCLASRFAIPRKPFLLTLCFALTTGSVMSPIGNPQNLLIVSYWHQGEPLLLFASGLFIPTIISLVLVFFWMRWRCRGEEGGAVVSLPCSADSSSRLQYGIFVSFLILSGMIVARICMVPAREAAWFPLGWIAIAAAIPILVFSRDRSSLVREIDWGTLIFFASMFILMQGVYNSGLLQDMISFEHLTNVPFLFSISVILSQVISNVPYISLFQPVISISKLSTAAILALAAGSTIAGNMTILGAASNVIVLQQGEREGIPITFREFAAAGIPLTLLQGIVYLSWFTLLY